MNIKKEKYRTISSPTSSLFKDRGSKFLGYAYPIRDTNDAKQKLQELKKEHAKATHHCFAYRIGTDGLSFRSSDDGEPSGSAGRPILGQISSYECTDILIVVVRYYGGTMLGVPGLIHAYKTAAAAALEQAQWTDKWIMLTVELSFDYNAMSEVLYLLKQCEADIIRQELQLFCTVIAGIPQVYFEQYSSALLGIRGLTLRIIT